MRYSKEWESTVKRMGRWIDFKRDYKVLFYKLDARFELHGVSLVGV